MSDDLTSSAELISSEDKMSFYGFTWTKQHEEDMKMGVNNNTCDN